MINVNQSRVKLWRRCRRAHHYKFVEKLEKKVKGRPLTFGSLIHDCLEALLKKKTYEPVLKKYEKEIKGVFEEERVELGLDTVIPAARTILPLYEEHWKKDGLTYLAIEKEFSIPLIQDVTFKGTLDGIVQDQRDSRVWLFERKTAKSIPDDNFRMADVQTVVYFDALAPSGFRRKVDGLMWDYIRSKPPTVPQVLKSGQMSERAIDTLPEIYLSELKKHKIDPKPYKEFMAGLEGKRSSFFRRIKLPMSSHLRKEVMEDFKATAQEIRDHGDRKERTLSNWDCPRCEFFPLCMAELRGQDADYIRQHDYRPAKDRYEKKPRDSED